MKNALLSVIVTMCCAPVFGQGGPPPVIGISRESIKEGRGAAHEKVEMDFARAFRKANFPYHYLALNAMTGTTEVWFLEEYPSFEAVEKADKEFAKPPMKNDMEMLDARDGELRSGMRNTYAVYHPELSYRPDLANLGKTRYVRVNSYRVRLGQVESFMESGKKILAAYQKANLDIPVIAYEVVAGVPEGLYLFLTPMESLKTMDERPAREKALMEALGAENFSNIMKGTGQVIVSIETNLLSVNPRMSYVSKETEDVDPAFWRPKMTAAPKPSADAKPKETKPGQ